jgi:hypothetical protein
MREHILTPLRTGIGAPMIIYASLLHTSWAGLIWWDSSALGATTLAEVATIAGAAFTPWLCLAVAAVAIYGLWMERAVFRFLCMVPQQCILVFSAVGASCAIWNSAYADGVLRPMAFIAADQMWSLIAVFSYSLAVVIAAANVGKHP